ncbi:hypothetical protein FBU59_000097 [Linderina macrospora]|uniref:Uncharacterized protein n=1 Tax=Linderina macrospora TaxID=4868 RepID=A0ACC1JHM5_9FUNG|nr:hypothetical protein FBU59_000097 [Linderina macrospora]
MDDDRYLESGFDPSALKVSAIRNILVKHEVEYPSNAKKSELLRIMQTNVLDKNKTLRKEARRQKHAKADSRDIEMVAAGGSRTRAHASSSKHSRKSGSNSGGSGSEHSTDVHSDITAEQLIAAAAEKRAKVKARNIKILEAAVEERAQKPKKRKKRKHAETLDETDKTRKGPEEEEERKTATSGTSGDDDEAVFTPAMHKQVEAQRQRASKRRLAQHGEDQDHDGDSGSAVGQSDEMLATPKAKSKKNVKATADRRSNFSDDNPFQASPDSARKRRRKTPATDKSMTTPLSALRTSKPSDVSFQVSLPGTPTPKKTASEFGSPTSPSRGGKDAEDVSMLTSAVSPQSVASPQKGKGSLQRSRVSDLVAKYQGQISEQDAEPVVSPRKAQAPILEDPEKAEEVAEEVAEEQVEEQVEESVETTEPMEVEMEDVEVEIQRRPAAAPVQPLFDLSVNPEIAAASTARHHQISASARPGRFTMSPESLRQLASEHSASIASPRRRTMGGEMPPIAPNIPVVRVDGQHHQQHNEAPAGISSSNYLSLAQAQADAASLQRRRVETLRMQHRGDGSHAGHSRHSSIASITSAVSEARGVPATPASADAASQQSSEPQSSSSSSPWGWRVLVWGAIAAAMAVWRSHEQFAIGFGSARAGEAMQLPPTNSVLTLPEPIARDAPPLEQAQYYMKLARAMYLSPAPLACPEHASCEPYVAIPASHASQQMLSARDQWVVPAANGESEARSVMQCDPGYVMQFPPYSSRVMPLLPECVRDLSTENRVKRLADAIVRECARFRGEKQCEMPVYDQVRELLARHRKTQAKEEQNEEKEDEEDGEDIEADMAEGSIAYEFEFIERFGIKASELRELMRSRKSPRLSDEEFEAAFDMALDELNSKRTSEVQDYLLDFGDDKGDVSFLVSHRPAYPFLCRLRRFALSALIGNMTSVLSGVGLFVVALIASRRIAAHRAEVRAADALVGSALDRLKRQARRHYLDPALSPSPSIPSMQLRDLLLLSSDPSSTAADGGAADSAYFDPRTRASVWDRVRVVVERNANVRCRTTAVRGEPMRVWEWIGPTDDVEIFTPVMSPANIAQA